MAKDHYSTLGVPKNASDEDIKRAFRKLAHQYHPDKTGGNDARFKEINEAYQVLGDPDKRKKYDQFGPGFEQMGGFGGGGPHGFGGFDFSQGGIKFDFGEGGGIGDLFGDLFGGAARGGSRTREKRGRHIEMDLPLTFKEAAFGVDRELRVYKHVACADCSGTGADKGSKVTDCLQCGGTGQVRKVQQTIIGNFQTVGVCDRCEGEGKVPEKKCRRCGGNGVIKEERVIQVKVPAGINDGEVLRISGEGEAVVRGKSGDLYLAARIKADPDFRRDGFDVHSVKEISFSRAALGGSVAVATLDGDVDLKIPAGTQPATVFRLKGKGVPFLKRSGRGDHFVEIKVKVPDRLTRDQRRILEEWDQD
jgi:molecular chaperone DnaJ